MPRDRAISDDEASHNVARFLESDAGNILGAPFSDALADVRRVNNAYRRLATRSAKPVDPIPMLLWCPSCHTRHVDAGEWVTRLHKTHQCQACGLEWCPARVHTVGVQVLPSIDKG